MDMKPTLIALVCLTLPCLAHAAPADSTAAVSRPNSLRAGVWALQFDVNGQLLSVDSFAGGVSLKRQFTPKSAVRFGIGVGGSSQFEEDITANNPQTTDDAQTGSIEAVYQRYWNPAAAVNAYWTLGPIAGYSHDTSESSNGSVSSTRERNYKSVGGIAALGAEWFAARQLSFHAEYSARGYYSWQEQTSTGYPSSGPPVHRRVELNGWSIGTNSAVRLGMSVYL
jgi:hypothetical protein